METVETVKTEKTTQKIQLVKGAFTASEACDVVCALIDEKINFHKIQRLQIWEGNHASKTGHLDGRIQELQEERKLAKQFIMANKGKGYNLKIQGTLEITVAD
ncbi:hypothetical protein [Pareuzebyella sediminis]|uniref:hypothetical protein n=1 Tax=Pareuzebyella sediminis TaxID=2607998 RepID=UPI0011EBB1A7|nr:hypothetical protein [Pareuzebyella sediminis]